MNRLVLIGNGFDLAHGLKTSYADFINWYWEYRRHHLTKELDLKVSEDLLCRLECLEYETWFVALMYDMDLKYAEGSGVYNYIINSDKYKKEFSLFFERIHNSIETKGWVDIENEYYDLLKKYVQEDALESKIEKLHKQLNYLQEKLVEYLCHIEISDKIKTDIRQKIYAPFDTTDISVEGRHALEEHIKYGLQLNENSWNRKLRQYGSDCYSIGWVDDYRKKYGKEVIMENDLPDELLLPNQIMLLNFNYTDTVQKYCKDGEIFTVNQIHGNLKNPLSVIFGYGDELDEGYKTLLSKNENKLLCNIKSIHYLESDNYRKMLSFIESEPYQILIRWHSCGHSDRTLLNTLFEYRNCVSVKPYYYKGESGTDNYLELVQNISRNFTDMKLMRDRVVNKTYCKPLSTK